MEQTDRDLLIAMQVSLEANTRMTEKMYKTMFEGNGKPSMMSRQDAVETHIENCPAKEIGKKVENIEKKMWYATGAMAFFGVVATAVAKKLGWL